MFPLIQCQCFDKRRGVYLLEKVSVFIKIRLLFWPEISALGVFFNFDKERMRPPKYPSVPIYGIYILMNLNIFEIIVIDSRNEVGMHMALWWIVSLLLITFGGGGGFALPFSVVM